MKIKEIKNTNNLYEFIPGERVHWFEYSHDGIITNGGFGTIIEVNDIDFAVEEASQVLVILTDDGSIKEICSWDVDPFHEMDDKE